jgi:penicillin amidase
MQLRRAVSQRALPADAPGLAPAWELYRVVLELTAPRREWFGPSAVAARNALMLETLQTAYAEMTTRQGGDPQHWSWGALHQAYFRHPLDGAAGSASLLDRGPVERPGDGDVVQATDYDNASFEQTSGASYREIFDLADWDKSVAINAPGQSGQPGSQHYDDLLPLWSSGQYFPLKFSKAAVDAVTTDLLILQP